MSLTTNKNYLSPVGFMFSIDRQNLANVDYFCVSASIPEISTNELQTPYRSDYGYEPGEKIEYAPLTIRFLVDEDMNNYREIFNWLYDNVKGTGDSTVDASLSVLTSHNNVSQTIQFTNCFPTSLSSLEFNAQNTDVEYFTAEAVLRYNYYRFV